MPKRPPAKKMEKASAVSTPRGSPQVSSILFCVLLGIVTLTVYWPVRHFDYLNYDDPDYVAQNPMIQSGLHWENIKWAFTHTYSFNWHPITWISHMLDCQLFGVNPGAHHLVNLAFHIANSCLIFLLFRKMTSGTNAIAEASQYPEGKGRGFWLSAFVAGVFALHPLHVESVAWVCERKDVLSTFFWLLTTLAYLGYVQGEGSGKKSRFVLYALALFTFSMGLMSKPMLVTLPCTLLLLDYWPLGRVFSNQSSAASGSGHRATSAGNILLEKVPFFALSVTSSLATFFVQRSEGAVANTESFSVGLRIANAFISYARYLGKTFWPEGLMIFYPYPVAWETWKIIGSIALIILISGVAIWKAKRWPFLFVGWFWFLGTMVPVIGLVQVGIQSMADRYMYVPMIGLTAAFAWGVWEMNEKVLRFGKTTNVIIFGLLTIVCAVCTGRQLQYWQDSTTVFEHAVAVLPDSVMAHVMAGNAYNERGNPEKAMLHYNEALKRSPNFAEVHFNLGNLLIGQNRLDDAIFSYEKALQLRPDYVDARANLAYAYSSQHKNEEALAQEEEASKLRPDDPILLRNMSVDLIELKRWDAAEKHLRRAIEIKPDDPIVYKLLGDVLMAKNRFSEAVPQYEKALELKPDFGDAKRRLDYIKEKSSTR